jgi:hypothetical protein
VDCLSKVHFLSKVDCLSKVHFLSKVDFLSNVDLLSKVDCLSKVDLLSKVDFLSNLFRLFLSNMLHNNLFSQIKQAQRLVESLHYLKTKFLVNMVKLVRKDIHVLSITSAYMV